MVEVQHLSNVHVCAWIVVEIWTKKFYLNSLNRSAQKLD